MDQAEKEQRAAQELLTYVTYQLEKKVKKESIAKYVAKKTKVEIDEAMRYVEETEKSIIAYKETKEYKLEMLKGGKKLITGGILWTVGGIVATVVSYSAAASNSGGGTYYLFWGAVIFGLYDLFRGIAQKKKYLRMLREEYPGEFE